MRHRSGWIVCLCLCACLLLAGTAGAAEPEAGGGAVSRGAFVDALYDAHVAHGGTPVVSDGAAPFRDVGSWSPYFEALCWGRASGIASGYSGGTFRSDAPVSRQQAAVMLYRYARVTDLVVEEGAGQELTAYQDGDAVPDWCRDAVAWAADCGLWFSGSAGTLAAGEPVTQEELTVLLERLYTGGMAPAAADSLTSAPEGLTLEIVSCSPTGAVLELKNGTEQWFRYGESYGLYRQINGGWYEMNGEMAVIAIAYDLGPGESQQITHNWGYLDGLLPAGTYGIAISGELTEEAWTLGGESAAAAAFATFAIR